MALCPARAQLSKKNPMDWETRSHFLPHPSTQGSCQGLGQDRRTERRVWLAPGPLTLPPRCWGRVPRKLPWLAGGSTAGPPKHWSLPGCFYRGCGDSSCVGIPGSGFIQSHDTPEPRPRAAQSPAPRQPDTPHPTAPAPHAPHCSPPAPVRRRCRSAAHRPAAAAARRSRGPLPPCCGRGGSGRRRPGGDARPRSWSRPPHAVTPLSG